MKANQEYIRLDVLKAAGEQHKDLLLRCQCTTYRLYKSYGPNLALFMNRLCRSFDSATYIKIYKLLAQQVQRAERREAIK